MPIQKPFRRTCRQFVDGSYTEGGRWKYLLHKKFARDPRHYIRALLLIQTDMVDLFSYIEPADTNARTYSHRIQQLLMRACVEIEANCTAILTENGYKTSKNLTIDDYKLVEKSHRLSGFEIRIPGWRGKYGVRTPFAAWKNGSSLTWYQSYNKSKHDRHGNFQLATFDVLIDAICGLNVLLSAQFHDEDYSSQSKGIRLEGSAYIYEGDDGMEPSIGDLFRIRFPTDWPLEERYDFSWPALSELEDPFDSFDYAAHRIQ